VRLTTTQIDSDDDAILIPRESASSWLVLSRPVDLWSGQPHGWRVVEAGDDVRIPLLRHDFVDDAGSALAASFAVGAALAAAVLSNSAPLRPDAFGIRRIHLAWKNHLPLQADNGIEFLSYWFGIGFQVK
jgi:hypothetical protein